VALRRNAIERFLEWGVKYFDLDEGSTSLSLGPWNFDVSLLDTWAVLAGGGSVVCANPQRLPEPGYLADLLQDRDITFLQVVPSTLDVLVHAAGPHTTFPFVKDVIVTGGAAGVTTRRAAVDLFPQARFHNVYGSTEVNDCLLHTAPAAEFASTVALPLGAPVAGCDVRVDVDGEILLLADCPDGTEGELLVRTPWMAAGYIEGGRIRPLIDPGPDHGLYRMKDRVLIAGERIAYLGRSDRTVKLRGQRLNLDEIERLASATGMVRAACAWLSASDAGDDELHLAYTTAEGAAPGSGLQIRLALSGRLPPYAIPSRLHAFGPAFPLNGNGKPHLERIKTQAEGKRP
jgi:non-ribosomal peptide synthetase component F